MKSIFAQVIARKNYDLSGLLRRIDAYHVEGKLTDAEREELYAQAQTGASPQYDYGREIEAVWKAIRELREAVAGLTQTQPSEPPAEEDEWPEYVQPTGAHDAYQAGDKISFQGERYVCTLNNCVWSLADYPAGWQKQA